MLACAWSCTSVLAVKLDCQPKGPLSPKSGAMKVTGTPDTGLPAASVTVTCKGLGKAVSRKALCCAPPVALMDKGAPVVTLNGLLVADATPEELASNWYLPASAMLRFENVARPVESVLTIALPENR